MSFSLYSLYKIGPKIVRGGQSLKSHLSVTQGPRVLGSLSPRDPGSQGVSFVLLPRVWCGSERGFASAAVLWRFPRVCWLPKQLGDSLLIFIKKKHRPKRLGKVSEPSSTKTTKNTQTQETVYSLGKPNYTQSLGSVFFVVFVEKGFQTIPSLLGLCFLFFDIFVKKVSQTFPSLLGLCFLL